MFFPELKAPEGFAYCWKRHVFPDGDEDTENINQAAKNGWVYVPSERHPEVKTDVVGKIARGGLMLMERPIEQERAARKAEQKKADDLYNYYAERLEGALAAAGQPSSVPRCIDGVIVYPTRNDDPRHGI